MELLSIDLSNYCTKQCPFCYNHSTKEGNVMWTPEEVIAFAADCIANGMKAVSLGGGEPFEYDGIWTIIDALYPLCYLSVTTNGLKLGTGVAWETLAEHRPDKIHISLHNPGNMQELSMVEQKCIKLQGIGIKPGCNLLVRASQLEECKAALDRLSKVLSPDQIILIPLRFGDTPTPGQLASVANGRPFQSPSCLLSCRRPDNFVSVSWDKKVNFCSYAKGKAALETLDYAGLIKALGQVQWGSCLA